MSYTDQCHQIFTKNSATQNLKSPWTSFLKILNKAGADNKLKSVLLFVVGIYRTIGTTHMGGSCRFTPSCSEYAVQCIHKHNSITAIKLIIKRLLKCRPFSTYGFDPVPDNHKFFQSSRENINV